MDKSNGMFERSADTATLVAFVGKSEPGQLITRSEVAAKIGRDTRDQRLAGAMQSVFRILQRERNMVFETVRGEGWRRMPDADVADAVSERTRESVYRRALQGDKKINAALQSGNLTAEQTASAVQKSSVLKMLAETTKAKTFAKLGQRVSSTGSVPIPTQKMLDHLKEVC